jgi:hypothetical protein
MESRYAQTRLDALVAQMSVLDDEIPSLRKVLAERVKERK